MDSSCLCSCWHLGCRWPQLASSSKQRQNNIFPSQTLHKTPNSSATASRHPIVYHRKQTQAIPFPLLIFEMDRNCTPTHGRILIMGELQKLKIHSQSNLQQIDLNSQRENRGRSKSPGRAVKVYSQGNVLAFIDEKDDGWLLSEPFDCPINLSALIRRKISKMTLGEKEVIVEAKKDFFLLNWGSKKLLDAAQLTKVSTYSCCQFDHLFQAYIIKATQSDFYHYSPEKKVDNSNRLYHVDSRTSVITGYPTSQAVRMPTKVKGISVGKYHCLCWDQAGKLYSWGCRSLGLGYGVFPSEEVIESPQPVNTNKLILSAFAGCHYSLALSSQGKKEVNQINEQPIFQPRPLQFRHFHCCAKFVSLKGRENNYAALSSVGQLYVWGLNSKQLLNPMVLLPPTWKGNYIYEPVLQTDLVNLTILDFTIENNYLAVVVGQETQHSPEEQYWSLLKEKAKKQLSQCKMLRVSTQSNQVQILRRKYRNNILTDCSRTETERREVLPPKMHVLTHQTSQTAPSLPSKANLFKKTAPVTGSGNWSAMSNGFNHKRQVSDQIASCGNLNLKQPTFRCSQIGQKKGEASKRATSKGEKKFTEGYSVRLQEILEKKRQIEKSVISTKIKHIDESSVEFKLRKKEREEASRKHQQEETVLHSTLSPLFIKQYLTTLLLQPLQEARDQKISNFARSLLLERVEKNIKRLFVSARIKFATETLKNMHPSQFAKLAFHFRAFVCRFRKRKQRRSKQTVVRELTKNILREKIKAGLWQLQPKVTKLQRLREWMAMVHKERKACLKELWNNFILTSFRLKDSNDSAGDPSLTFHALYQQRIDNNRALQLTEFMRQSRKHPQPTPLPPKDLKRRPHIKFQDELKERTGLMSQLLPFSLHYNYFRRPKNLEISLTQTMRCSSAWIQTERNLLSETLDGLIVAHNLEFCCAVREYEVALANFIRSRYDTFYEKRWRYIIEYNQVERTLSKKKKEAQLRRLLALIGMQQIVDQDCIPEKHMVLEEALRRKDAPSPPDPLVPFDHPRFTQIFRKYWEQLNQRAKVAKKRQF